MDAALKPLSMEDGIPPPKGAMYTPPKARRVANRLPALTRTQMQRRDLADRLSAATAEMHEQVRELERVGPVGVAVKAAVRNAAWAGAFAGLFYEAAMNAVQRDSIDEAVKLAETAKSLGDAQRLQNDSAIKVAKEMRAQQPVDMDPLGLDQ